MNQKNPYQLPNEIWGSIFSFFDNPCVLLKNRRVCKQWRQLIDKKRNVYVKEYANKDTNVKERGLLSATQNGDLDKIFALEELGANLHLQQPEHLGYGNTLLHIAAQKGHSLLVDYFLKKGLDPTIQNADNKTAKELAKKAKNYSIGEIFDNYQRAVNPSKTQMI